MRYIDPYFALDNPDVPFCKHYKFAYQREFRFVARGINKLGFAERKIEIGSIKDVADLIEFDSCTSSLSASVLPRKAGALSLVRAARLAANMPAPARAQHLIAGNLVSGVEH